MTWQTIQGGKKKQKKNRALPTVYDKFQPRWLSGDHRGEERQQDERIHLSWSSAVCCVWKNKIINPSTKSTSSFLRSVPAKKNPVPPRSATCQICATDCWSRSYRVRLLRRRFSLEKSGYQAPPRKQKAQERERERGWRSVDAQRGSRSEKWDLHKKNYKMPTNASLWVAGVQDDASYLLLTVKDDFHRFLFIFFASGCTFKKKKKKIVTHVFLHLISIFHPSMSQNECNVMIQVAAFWKYLTHFIF